MKAFVSFLLILLSALALVPQASHAQSSGTVALTTPVPLGVEFHAGETVRYTFSEKMNLTSRVDPRASSESAPSYTPRQYQVEGEVVATFAATQPGEPLRGAVQFQGLTVKNWVSSAKVADWEARLRQLEATSTALTTAPDGNLKLAEMAASPHPDLFDHDIESLRGIAQALFKTRIASQSLARGEQRASADFPIPGVLRPGIKVTTVTEYVTDVAIAGHPNAEVRLSANVPDQSHVVSSPSSASKVSEKLHGAGVWTYLLDLDAHQISFLHKTLWDETGLSAEATDSNVDLRIPVHLATINEQVEVTARRAAASASPEREADLTAFEKSLPTAPPAAAEAAGTTATTKLGGEVSLGELAKRLRAEGATQQRIQLEMTPSGGGAASEAAPVGFKEESLPNGHMSVFVPAEAAEESDSTANVVHLHALLTKPRAIVTMSMGEVALGPIGSPDAALEATVNGLRAKGFKVGWSERKSINGKPGIVFQLPLEAEGKAFLELQANVISGSEGFVATCGTMAEDFPNVESICRTVVESIRIPPAGTALPGSAAAAEGAPTGFKQVTFPSGEMTVSIPAQASEMQRASEMVEFGGYLGTPPTAMVFALREMKVGLAASPDNVLDEMVRQLSTHPQVQVVRREKTSINGQPAEVLEILSSEGQPMHALQANMVSGGKVFLVICSAAPADFPRVESLCQTVVNSIRAP
jgi:hypothetical protein